MLWHETSGFSQFVSKPQEKWHETSDFSQFVSKPQAKWHETPDFNQFVSKPQAKWHETPKVRGFVPPAITENSKIFIQTEDFGVLSCFISEFSHPDFKQPPLFVLLHEVSGGQCDRPQQHRENEAGGDAEMRTEIECNRG